MISSLEKSILETMLAKQSRFHGCTEIIIPDEFASQVQATWNSNGSVTFEAAPGCCICCLLDDDNCEDITEPKPARRRRAKKPKRTLRDAIKESIRTSESEQDESKKSDERVQSDTHRKPATKKVKNQGKSRTFKRKTKKPGRV